MYARAHTQIGWRTPDELNAAKKRKEKKLNFVSAKFGAHLLVGRSNRSYRQLCVSRLMSCVWDNESAPSSDGQSGSELEIYEFNIFETFYSNIAVNELPRKGTTFVLIVTGSGHLLRHGKPEAIGRRRRTHIFTFTLTSAVMWRKC